MSTTQWCETRQCVNFFKAAPGSFGLVLSDMTMPNIAGDQPANKPTAVRPDIPIITCTGFGERFNRVKDLATGIKAFRMKPIIKSDPADPAETVLKVLDEA